MLDLPNFDHSAAIIRPTPNGYAKNKTGVLIPDWRDVRAGIKETERGMLPGMFNPMLAFGNARAAVPTFQDVQISNSDLTTYSFTTSLPTPAFAGRWLIIAVMGYATSPSRTVSSVTVFGNSATLVPDCRTQSTSTNHTVELWAIQLDSGNSGTVSVTFSAQMHGAAVQIFSVSDLQSITPTGTPVATTAASAAATINIPALGFGLGFAYSGGVTSPSATWAGLLLVRTQSQTVSAVGSTSSAMIVSDSSIPSLAVSCTWSSTANNGRCAIFATFR